MTKGVVGLVAFSLFASVGGAVERTRLRLPLLILGAALLSSSSILLGEDLLRAGMYEVMSTMEMTNMPTAPQLQTPSRMTHCYSADDVRVINAGQAVARGKIKNTRCIVTESSFAKNRSVWVAKCEGQGTTHYDTTYGGDNFESTVTTTSPGHESVITRQKGRRIGECK
jgi:hypothetical protein